MRSDPLVASHDSPASFTQESDLGALHEAAREGDTWLQKAQGLRNAALIIYERWEGTGMDLRGPRINRDLHDVAIMLAGQALENLLKGIIVKLDSSTLTQRGIEFGSEKGAHDLIALGQRAKVNIEDDERRVLEYGSDEAQKGRAFGLLGGHRATIESRTTA
jgi:hypothetical protein